MGNRTWAWIVVAGAWAAVPAVRAAAAEAAGDAARTTLGDPVELLKLPREAMQPLTSAWPFFRLSGDGKRFLYLRRSGKGADVIPYIGGFGPPRWDDPVPWDGFGIFAGYARLGMTGIAWRADGQRVLFLQPKTKDGGGFEEHYERTMSPWHMCWDLPNPQFTRCRHMSLDGAPACTALSYSPDGKLLWTAFGDWANHTACGITEWDEAKERGATLYKGAGVVILHLAPSPDGTHLAWLEMPPRLKKGSSSSVAVFDVRNRKVIRRIGLGEHDDTWTDAQPPIWTADSKAVIYGEVAFIDKLYRREVRLWPLEANSPQLVTRDAVAVAAARGGIICSRGPAANPFKDLLSSFAPAVDDRPRTNDVVFCALAEDRPPQVLVPNAFAQQVLGDALIYAQPSGGHTLILKATLSPAAAPAGK